MDVTIPFGGQALNAVDGKGRVSLPAAMRNAIERRAALAKAADLPVDDKILYISEDEELPCLAGFDEAEYFTLAAELKAERAREAQTGTRKSLIRRDGGGDETFAPLQPTTFDKAGRMNLTGLLRDVAGIEDYAFFVGQGAHFDIWSPRRAHAHYTQVGNRRMLTILERLCQEKEVSL